MQNHWRSSKFVFRVFGIAVSVLCCVYVVITVYRTGALQIVSQSISQVSSVFALLIVLYVVSTLGIAAAFAFLVWGVSKEQQFRADIIAVHAVTQIAKYLPTNILHLVGRHAVLRRRGLTDVVLIGVGVGEVALLLLAALSLAALGASDEAATYIEPTQCFLAIIGAVTVALLLIATASIRGNLAVWILPFLTWRAVTGAIAALSVYSLFFALSGAILWLLLTQAIPVPTPPGIGRLVSYAAMSWSIGFVSPGAAAGIGVRETMLIFLLGGSVEPAPATSAAVAYRLVTTLGDVITCALGGILWRPHR